MNLSRSARIRLSSPRRLSLPKGEWYVYILLCSDDSLYTGSSNNPNARFNDHKNGKGGAYTRSHKVVELLYIEQHESKSSALKRESQIKGWSRRKKIKILKLDI